MSPHRNFSRFGADEDVGNDNCMTFDRPTKFRAINQFAARDGAMMNKRRRRQAALERKPDKSHTLRINYQRRQKIDSLGWSTQRSQNLFEVARIAHLKNLELDIR